MEVVERVASPSRWRLGMGREVQEERVRVGLHRLPRTAGSMEVGAGGMLQISTSLFPNGGHWRELAQETACPVSAHDGA